MKRILIYSHDTFGLGNIRRMLEVAHHLVQSSVEVSVLVLTGSPMLHVFRIPAGIDYIKLPCLMRDTEGHYASRSLSLSLAATVRLRANLIRSAVADFEPDLILVDKKPFGVEDELSGALHTMSQAARRPRMVLLLRDILDSAESTRRVWRKNGYYEAIETYYDQVLVVGCPQVFDLRHEYQMPAFTAAKLSYCGYISRQPGRTTREQMRRQLGVGELQPLLLVTPGGGEDGYALLDNALQALQGLSAKEQPHMHVVCGPELNDARRAAVHQKAKAMANVSVQDFSDDMMALMAAADVVLSMAGYNTVCELLTLRKPALLVPRNRPGVEQTIRAERMAALGLIRMLRPEDLSPETLRTALQAELQRAQAPAAAPLRLPMDGLDQVTAALFEWLDLPAASSTQPHVAHPAASASPPQRTLWRGAREQRLGLV